MTTAVSDIHPAEPGATERIGFIGLGVMGRGMANCLLRAGHALTVYNRSPAPAAALGDAGAAMADSPAALGRACQIVFLCLSDTAAVEAVVFGTDGLAEGLAAGSLVVDTSTISATASRSLAQRLAEQGVGYLDAPITGGAQGAADGTLTCMVGGSAEHLARAEPVMAAFARQCLHIGDVGAGQICKACNQVAVTAVMMGVAEAFVLARQHGVDPAQVRQVLLGGSARSQVLERNAERLLTRDFKPGFRAELMRKDLRLALQAGEDGGAAMPSTALTLQLLESACQTGGLGQDWSVLARHLERLSGIDVD